MRIGMIGIGDIAKKAYLPVLTRVKGIELILNSRNEEVLKEVCEEYRIKYTTSLDELIEMGIEGAFVHSSTKSHYEIVKKLLKNNINVYVDKPISYSLEETKELLTLAKEKKLVLKVGFNRRNSPSIVKLKGENNTVIHQKNRVNLPGESRVYVYDDFIHVVDTVSFLMGEVKDMVVHVNKKGDIISNLMVNFIGEDNVGIGLMNRESGMTEEKVEVFKTGKKTVVQDIDKTISYAEDKMVMEKESDWTPTLEKRGFYNLVEGFFEDIKRPEDYSEYDEILKTHILCEEILDKVEEK